MNRAARARYDRTHRSTGWCALLGPVNDGRTVAARALATRKARQRERRDRAEQAVRHALPHLYRKAPRS